MTIIEQIKAEIERRIRSIENCPFIEAELGASEKRDGKLIAYKDLLSFVSNLESEKPMNQDGLEEEIQRFLSNATKMNNGEWKGKYPISEMGFGVVARHFYDLGCRRTAEKYDEIEYNRQRAEESVPDDLEEVAEQFYPQDSFDTQAARELGVACFVDGAKWDREQMMKEAVEAHIYQSANPVSEIGHQLHQAALLYEDKENAPYLKAGDKIHIIIVKED